MPRTNCRCGRPACYASGRCQQCTHPPITCRRPRAEPPAAPAPHALTARGQVRLAALREAAALYLARTGRWVSAMELERECGILPCIVERVMDDARFRRDGSNKKGDDPSWILAPVPAKGEASCP